MVTRLTQSTIIGSIPIPSISTTLSDRVIGGRRGSVRSLDITGCNRVRGFESPDVYFPWVTVTSSVFNAVGVIWPEDDHLTRVGEYDNLPSYCSGLTSQLAEALPGRDGSNPSPNFSGATEDNQRRCPLGLLKTFWSTISQVWILLGVYKPNSQLLASYRAVLLTFAT
jgi:hypothetical protein